MRAVWGKGLSGEKNVELLFVARLKGFTGEIEIEVKAATAFRVCADGAPVGFGPARVAEGYCSANVCRAHATDGTAVAVSVAGYGVPSYQYLDRPFFFAAEIRGGGRVLARTEDFSCARVTARVQKVERYSYQRNFVEVYDYPAEFGRALLGERVYPGISVEPAVLPPELCRYECPPLKRMPLGRAAERGALVRRARPVRDVIPDYAKIRSDDQGFFPEELEYCMSDRAAELAFSPDPAPFDGDLSDGCVLYELEREKTGWFDLDAECEAGAELFILFDEIIPTEAEGPLLPGWECYREDSRPLIFFRGGTINALRYRLPAGRHRLTSMEPYSAKYVRVCARGRVRLHGAGMFLAENPDAGRMTFRADDGELQSVFDAARNTFAQNACDLFMDCPSRERAGWLCDSWFTARAEALFTGGNTVEKRFLTNFAVAPPVKNLPEEMFAECYPADFPDGSFIPNWAMWLVIELSDYRARTGDGELPGRFAAKVGRLLEYFSRFENECGLLEKLDKWVFVEWSDSNKYVRDVNYPTNMLYALCLDCAADLYKNPGYAEKAARVRAEIVRQSWNGEFFADHAVREGETLRVRPEVTETCQYYALFTGLAAGGRFDAFREKMFAEFGPTRGAAYPEIAPSNAFIGNYLRLECLLAAGRRAQALSEITAFFGGMAARTGTLWEQMSAVASCNHGFASYAACGIVAAVTGYLGRNDGAREIYIARPAYPGSASAEIPVPGGTLRITVKDGEAEAEIPQGYRVVKRK